MYSKAKLAFYSRQLLTSYFCVPVPYDEKDTFWGVSSRRSSSLQKHSASATSCCIDLDYCDIEWFASEMKRDHSFSFENTPEYCIYHSFVEYQGYSISSTGSLPRLVDIMVI